MGNIVGKKPIVTPSTPRAKKWGDNPVMTHDNMPARSDNARTADLELLGRRSDQATICPSEVARAIASKVGADPTGQAWRALMPAVHAAVDQMMDDGRIELRWFQLIDEALEEPAGEPRVRLWL